MHPFYDNKDHDPGSLVTAKEADFPDTIDNPTGKNIPAWDDDMKRVGTIAPGTQLVVFGRPKGNPRSDGQRTSMFVEVLSPEFGRVWVRACDIEYTK